MAESPRSSGPKNAVRDNRDDDAFPSASPGRTFNVWSVGAIALAAFMLGLYFGSAFLSPVPSAPPVATGDLPAGHPTVDPNNPVSAPPLTPSQVADAPPSVPASSVPTPMEDEKKYDLAFDDPKVRSAIAHATEYGALVRLGNEQFDAKHSKLAIAAYEKALKIHPFDPDVQTDLGVMYRAAHRTDDALNAFHKAASLDPKHVQSRYNIGVVLMADEHDYPGAIQAWEEYLKIAPSGPQADKVRANIAEMKKSAG